MASSLAAVVFDLDGTLVDTESVSDRVFTAALADLGHDITDEELRGLRGLAWPYTRDWLHQRFGVREEAFRERAQAAWDAAFDQGIDTFPDTVALLTELVDEGMPLALCTSAGRGHLDRVLDAVPVLGEAFAATVSASDVRSYKPDPEPYRLTASLLGSPPSRTVAIEDSPAGVAAARAAGLRVIGRHSGSRADLSDAHLEVDQITRDHLGHVLD